MDDPQLERVNRHLTRLKLTATRERLDALLQRAAKAEGSYLDFLDALLALDATQDRHPPAHQNLPTQLLLTRCDPPFVWSPELTHPAFRA